MEENRIGARIIMKTIITIKGTHCNACKMLIEDICKDTAGVKSCMVDFKTGKTTIEYGAGTDLKKIKLEIEKAGNYKVTLP